MNFYLCLLLVYFSEEHAPLEPAHIDEHVLQTEEPVDNIAMDNQDSMPERDSAVTALAMSQQPADIDSNNATNHILDEKARDDTVVAPPSGSSTEVNIPRQKSPLGSTTDTLAQSGSSADSIRMDTDESGVAMQFGGDDVTGVTVAMPCDDDADESKMAEDKLSPSSRSEAGEWV